MVWLPPALREANGPDPSVSAACRGVLADRKWWWWEEQIKANQQRHRLWHRDLPGVWWWGMSADDALESLNRICNRSVTTVITHAELPKPRAHHRHRAMQRSKAAAPAQ